MIFTSESVSEGHPDKVADFISDSVVDACLEQDPMSRVACETMISKNMVAIAGEITTTAILDINRIAREALNTLGYADLDVSVISDIHKQSPDIALGVDAEGAGDQGMMFGYACRETAMLMPAPITLAHRILCRLAMERKCGGIPWLRPDGKSQISIQYDEHGFPKYIDSIVVSHQHEDIDMIIVRSTILDIIQDEFADFITKDTKYFINPTGRFVIGGPEGDTGLTGRKIIVDTYGGMAHHGGGAFSGKDPTKVDRSASYMARHIAKSLVGSHLCTKCEIQLAYAIGVINPIAVYVNSFGTGVYQDSILERIIKDNFDLTPIGIINYLDLRKPIYRDTVNYGCFGRPTGKWEDIKKLLK